MPYPERLDPYEVLAHLHQLGYSNITAHQLKDFILDLKKLIKYDMRHGEDHEKENAPQNQDSSFTSYSSKCYSEKSGKKDKIIAQSSSSDESHISASCSSLTDSTSSSDDGQTKSFPSFPRPSKGRAKKVARSCDEQTTQSKRPPSSFIRPWRLHPTHATTGHGIVGGPTQKTDPVALYHRYKELWNQQKAPGEDSHSQLRWTIREKMLGQDPHPRPMSQASSTESRRRPHRL